MIKIDDIHLWKNNSGKPFLFTVISRYKKFEYVDINANTVNDGRILKNKIINFKMLNVGESI